MSFYPPSPPRLSAPAAAAALDPLVAGEAPAVQEVAAGGTPDPTTFNSFSGGSGGYSYAAVLVKPSGSSASLSGSGLGDWTITGHADGESYSIILTATDTVTGQTVSQTALVVIAVAAGAPTFTAHPIVDWKNNVASGSLSGAGSATIYESDGTTPRTTLTATNNGAGGTWGASWGSAGIILEGPNTGSGMWAWPLTVPATVNQNKDVICLNVQSKILVADNGASIGLGIGTTVSSLSGRVAGLRLDPGATTYTQATRLYNGGTSNGSNQNAVDKAVYVYVTAQIRWANGRTPTVVWRVDSSAPALPTTMVERDGVTWWGEDPAAQATSAATSLVGFYPSTIYLCAFIATGTATEYAIERHQFLTMDVP